ncbi:hypothetical protein [Brachybacterium paraconglomeratum]|uniref:hypothetical protein n=1 Tax=Brachybacterium paraconglomeratum TaxID=173362 RepID=UPI0022B044BE|nr:hypothetical protein [Brachybacterium paraconglomeratum]MCZ4325688.1 hypothetical protein [Brachybacterium paraconglomeratum]
MTTLYRSQLIESAEQAEALPEGTVVPIEDKDGPWEKRPDGYFQGAGRVLVDAYRVLDRIALVPIDAEEEWEDDGRPVWSLGEGAVTPADVDDYERRNGRRPSRRLVTPWEAAR